jgi:hypothetical protein
MRRDTTTWKRDASLAEQMFGPLPGWDDARRRAPAGGPGAKDDVLAWGYAKAANLLVDHHAFGIAAVQLFWPIAYLYRHAVELRLKDCIRNAELAITIRRARGKLTIVQACRARKLAPAEKVLGAHALVPLLDALEARLPVLGCNRLPSSVRTVMQALDQLDRTGEAFRYAAKKDGTPALEENVNFSLERLKKVYNSMLRTLDRADDAIVLAAADA